MSIPIIDTLNALGNFPVVNSNEVQCGDLRLDAVLNQSATSLAEKADKTYVDSDFAKKTDIPTDYGTYSKPSGGIPKSDLANDVQSSLSKADTALQSEQYTGTYSKPSGGIPKSDLSSAVQTSLGKADTALQTHQDISGKADKTYVDTELSGKADNSTVTALSSTVSTKADNSTVTALSERVSSVETEQDVLSARMDTFTTLEEGSTTGDAELMDIRVGADSTTYADAGTSVRSQISNVKSDLSVATGTTFYTSTKGKAIKVSDPTSYVSWSTWEVCEIDCQENDVFHIMGYGGPDARLWFFVDSSNKVLSQSDSGLHLNRYMTVVAPSNAVKLIANSEKSLKSLSVYKDSVAEKITDIVSDATLISETVSSVSASRNYDYMFAGYYGKAITSVNDKITIDVKVTGTINYNVYVIYDNSGSGRTAIGSNLRTDYHRDYVVDKNICGIRIWVASASNATLNVTVKHNGCYSRMLKYDNAVDNISGETIFVTHGSTTLTSKTNRDFVLEKPISTLGAGINFSFNTNDSTNRYHVYKILSDNTSVPIARFIKGSNDVFTTIEEDEVVTAFRVYPAVGDILLNELKITIKGTPERLSEIEEVANSVVLFDRAYDVRKGANVDFELDKPLSTKGDAYKLSVDIDNPTKYKVYVLYDKSGTRKNIGYFNGNAEVTFVVEDAPIIGIRYYSNDKDAHINSIRLEHLGIIDRFVNDEKSDSDDIIALHPRKTMVSRLASLKWRQGTSNNVFPNEMLSLIYFSDLHGDKNKLSRIMKFRKEYWDYIDDCIHAGDGVLGCFEDDYTFWGNAGAQSVLTCAGNHDVWTNGTGSTCKAWTTGYSEKQCYDRYISPFTSETKITPVTDKMYWYKDYPNHKVRLISLDVYHWKETVTYSDDTTGNEYPDGTSTDTGQQKAWFEATLESARTEGYHVIVMCHTVTNAFTPFANCSFSSLEKNPTGAINHEAIEAVQNFINAGGNFISWIAGHVHADWSGTLTEYPNQTLIVIDTARGTRDDGTTWSGNTKVDGTISQDCFNILSVDTNFKYIRMFRVGIEYDRYGRHIGSFLYNYDTHQIVWND